MKWKKRVSVILAAAVMAASALTGCGGGKAAGGAASAAGGSAAPDGTVSSEAVSHDSEMTFDIYDLSANYQGEQSGWYAKVLKDKFNLKLNIIAPQVSGDANALYQTRASSGNLGDIVILENKDFVECVKAQLVQDITDPIENSTNIKEYLEQIKEFNSQISGADGKLYGIPCEMTNTSPSTYTDQKLSSSPQLPWDYYTALGAPELKDLDDLLNVLVEMVKKYPTNSTGDKAYGLSLWKDWDSTSIENVNQITKWYNEEVKGSILLSGDGTMKALTDETGAYYKMLHFLYKANQMGLVDPDSATQKWDDACTKMKNKRVYLFWYNWQQGFWNTTDKAQKGDGYICIPVADTKIYQPSDSYYGDGRVWGVGSKVDGEKFARIMEFIDWYASPEGLTYQHAGMKDYNYTVNDDGTYTRINEDALMTNKPVPDELGGGGFNDGNNTINQWIVASISTNPVTKETYVPDYWSSTLKKNDNKLNQEWAEKYGAKNQIEYMQNHNTLSIVANVNPILPDDSTDIQLVRSQCGDEVCAASWKMIFAKDDAQFEQIWNEMKNTLQGLKWDTLVNFDKQKYQTIVDMRKAAE